MSFYDTEPDWADPGRLRDEREIEPVATCDECGATEVRITLAGVGAFCGRACATAAEQRMASAISARMFQRRA